MSISIRFKCTLFNYCCFFPIANLLTVSVAASSFIGMLCMHWCFSFSSLFFNLFTVLAKEHALFHLTLKTHYEDTFRRHLAPHCLAPHCLVTPHFPVTPHIGAALFDATFSCGATFWRRIVWRHIAWRRHIFLRRHILAPHCLAPHCLVTPHCPATPHFGATFFGDTLFGDATLGSVTLHRWA